MPLKIDKSNYETYKKVFDLLWSHKLKMLRSEDLPPVFDDLSPINVLSKWETESQSKALKGLKAGLADEINSFGIYASLETQSLLNAELKAAGLPGFFKLYSEVKDTLKQILKRQMIRNDNEYYIVNEILSDTKNALEKKDILTLNNAIRSFELTKSASKSVK